MYSIAPEYPLSAWIAGESGSVMVGMQIDPVGRVEEVWVQSSTSSLFERYALEAAKQWVFVPIMPMVDLIDAVDGVMVLRRIPELETASYLETHPGIIDSLVYEWTEKQDQPSPVRSVSIPFNFNH
ncbi:MAG: TonB family protein [Candidatus Nomurabacteria bacterium]|nr:MAG: TonB family protein [Candidatus Nomurabacteria bacterium]